MHTIQRSARRPTHKTPKVLTITEAARLLRIGGSTASEAANHYLAGNPNGLPVIRIGRCPGVPVNPANAQRSGHWPRHRVSRCTVTTNAAIANSANVRKSLARSAADSFWKWMRPLRVTDPATSARTSFKVRASASTPPSRYR